MLALIPAFPMNVRDRTVSIARFLPQKPLELQLIACFFLLLRLRHMEPPDLLLIHHSRRSSLSLSHLSLSLCQSLSPRACHILAHILMPKSRVQSPKSKGSTSRQRKLRRHTVIDHRKTRNHNRNNVVRDRDSSPNRFLSQPAYYPSVPQNQSNVLKSLQNNGLKSFQSN